MSQPFRIGDRTVEPGERTCVELPIPRLYTHTALTMPVHVLQGRRAGPRLFVSAAVHGDELNGVEIVRRLLRHGALQRLRGTLIAVPIVNVYAFLERSRVLPDRRDLNRAFPGSNEGSLAARLAGLFMDEIVSRATHGIDLHTGSNHRSNLPQIRARLVDPETERLARAFGTSIVLHAELRDGSLRQAGTEQGIPMLLYEAGEALRFDETAIRAGVHGVLSVMQAIGMLDGATLRAKPERKPFVAQTSAWVRAPRSGTVIRAVPLGKALRRGSELARIADPFGNDEEAVVCPVDGVVIGRLELPLVHEGDALFHVAVTDGSSTEGLESALELMDEPLPEEE